MAKRTFWNYRAIKRKDELAIYEVYYRSGKIEMISTDPIYPSGESLVELKEDILLMQKALNKPVLDYDQVTDSLMGRNK